MVQFLSDAVLWMATEDAVKDRRVFALDVLRQKCEFKGINVPRLDDLEIHGPDLEGAWDFMLGHQLPALLPVETFWNALPEFFAWMETGIAPEGTGSGRKS